MIRDKIKSKDYFASFLAEDMERLQKFDDKLKNGNVKEDRIPAIILKANSLNIGILVGKYSSGVPIIEIIDYYKKGVEYMQKGWNKDGSYVQMLWMLSIGIMLEIEDDYFNKLAKLIERDKINDYLFNYLIKFRFSSWLLSTDKFEFDVPYQALKDVISSDENIAPSLLKQYLEKKWYKSHSGSYWYNSHKEEDNFYFGYWSFESGAIVKIKGLNDTIFKDNQYYPYDMVHWKDTTK